MLFIAQKHVPFQKYFVKLSINLIIIMKVTLLGLHFDT